MKYSEMVSVYEQLSRTTKRLEKTEYVSEFLKKLPEAEIEQAVLLLQGRAFPAWDERELGVASQLMAKAIAVASGASAADIIMNWKKTGDLGQTAEHTIAGKKQHTLSNSELTVHKVFTNLQKLPTLTGGGSVERKLQLIAELLTSAKGLEARYITRTVLGELRIGLGEGTMRDAIAWAYFGRVAEDASKEEKDNYATALGKIQQAYDLTNDFATVAKKAKQGLGALGKVQMHIGKPIKVMLALKVDTAAEAFETVGKPAQAEYKYDGFRLEISKDAKGEIALYTRRLDNVTAQFPDVVAHINEHTHGKGFILDAEVVGYDPHTGHYKPFQDISQRIKRKHGIDAMAKQLPVEVNAFDILAHDGKSVINEPLRKRLELLKKVVFPAKRKIQIARHIVTDKEEVVESFFREAKQHGTEGLMIKNLDAPYKPGARVGHMLKYKKAMEPLDLVVVGAEWGEGKRSAWLSSFDLACRKDGKLLEIGKVATGLKEKREEGLSFDEMTVLLKPLITKEEGKHVLVKPRIVIEVAYEEIQKSPTYASGYALRFPRVLRNRTDEKKTHDANTLADVERLYEQQRKTSK
jgi:DNA ligase 1